MRVVLDCANGAAYKVGPTVLSELDSEVFAIGDEPNGKNINDGVGSVYPEATQSKVKELRADVGHLPRRRRRSLSDGRREGQPRRRRRDPRARGARHGRARRAEGRGDRRDGDEQPRPRARRREARPATGSHGGRRSLRRRGDARGRLQPRRRAVGASALPRSHHHRRRPHHGVADARDHAPHRPAALRTGARHRALPAGAGEPARRREATARRACRACRRRSRRSRRRSTAAAAC